MGESMFSLVPSILAMLQGIGKQQGCHNVTVTKTEMINETFIYSNETTLESQPLQPKFSISTFYIITFVIMGICFGAFLYVDCRKYVDQSSKLKSRNKDSAGQEAELVDSLLKPATRPDKEATQSDDSSEPLFTKEKLLLYILTFALTFFFYGILSGIQTYSSLPYGNSTYHLAVNLSNMFLPITMILSIWSYAVSIKRILIEFGIFMIFIVYIVVVACMSPCPPLVNHRLGSIIWNDTSSGI